MTRATRSVAANVLPLDDPQYKKQLDELRNLREFAELFQFISFFKQLLKISSFPEIEGIEEELVGIAPLEFIPKLFHELVYYLAAVKRNVTPETLNINAWKIFNYYGVPPEENPFGIDTSNEEIREFLAMTSIEKIKVLRQLTIWVSLDGSFRDKIEKVAANNQEPAPQHITQFRIEPIGWEGDFGVYYLLDDDRLYYLEDKAPDLSRVNPQELVDNELPLTPKQEEYLKNLKKAKQKRKAPARFGSRKRRVSNRRKKTDTSTESTPEVPDSEQGKSDTEEPEFISLAEALATETPIEEQTWKCVCVVLDDWEKFVAGLKNSKDEYQKQFYTYLSDEILPKIREHEPLRVAAAKNRIKQRELNQLIITRKRSSRLEERDSRTLKESHERQRLEDIITEESRLKEREKRLKLRDQKREEKRQMLEEKLHNKVLKEEAKKKAQSEKQKPSPKPSPSPAPSSESAAPRRSSRRIAMAKREEMEEENEQEEEVDTLKNHPENMPQNWTFDCYCGIFGENYDDGTPSVCCSQCEIWLHVACLREDEAKRLKIANENEAIMKERELKKKQHKEQKQADDDVEMADIKEEEEKTVKIENNNESTSTETSNDNNNTTTEEGEEEPLNTEFLCNRCVKINLRNQRKIRLAQIEAEKAAEKARRKAEKAKERAERKAQKKAEEAAAAKALQKSTPAANSSQIPGSSVSFTVKPAVSSLSVAQKFVNIPVTSPFVPLPVIPLPSSTSNVSGQTNGLVSNGTVQANGSAAPETSGQIAVSSNGHINTVAQQNQHHQHQQPSINPTSEVPKRDAHASIPQATSEATMAKPSPSVVVATTPPMVVAPNPVVTKVVDQSTSEISNPSELTKETNPSVSNKPEIDSTTVGSNNSSSST